jgi:hypothetical protein
MKGNFSTFLKFLFLLKALKIRPAATVPAILVCESWLSRL